MLSYLSSSGSIFGKIWRNSAVKKYFSTETFERKASSWVTGGPRYKVIFKNIWNPLGTARVLPALVMKNLFWKWGSAKVPFSTRIQINCEVLPNGFAIIGLRSRGANNRARSCDLRRWRDESKEGKRLKLGSTAALDSQTGQNIVRYREKKPSFLLVSFFDP